MRESAITRTVTLYKAECIVVNKDTTESFKKTITTVRNTDKERQATLPSNEKLAYTAKVETTERKYKMSLAKFCELAEVIDTDTADSDTDTADSDTADNGTDEN